MTALTSGNPVHYRLKLEQEGYYMCFFAVTVLTSKQQMSHFKSKHLPPQTGKVTSLWQGKISCLQWKKNSHELSSWPFGIVVMHGFAGAVEETNLSFISHINIPKKG